MSSSIKPLGNRILIKRATAQTTKGGILLPENAKEKPREGVVIAVGEGEIDDQGNREAIVVKPGDRVLFGAYSGTEVKQANKEDEELIIISQDDLFGIITT